MCVSLSLSIYLSIYLFLSLYLSLLTPLYRCASWTRRWPASRSTRRIYIYIITSRRFSQLFHFSFHCVFFR